MRVTGRAGRAAAARGCAGRGGAGPEAAAGAVEPLPIVPPPVPRPPPVEPPLLAEGSAKSAKLFPVLGELGGTAIKESLEGLVAASEDFRTGRLIVSQLEYTQAQERVSSVYEIAECRVALVMDQWDETRDLDLQRNAFRDFLHEPEQWPAP